MVDPFKSFFNRETISEMGSHLQRVSTLFDGDRFVAFCLKNLDSRELKQRSNRVVKGLEKFLPTHFPEAASILVASLDPDVEASIDSGGAQNRAAGIRGWLIIPMADFVGLSV